MEQEKVEGEEAQLPLTGTGDDTPADDAVTEGDTAPSGTEPAADPEKKTGTQKRFDELTKLRRDAERDADYWRGRAEASEAGQNIPATEPVVTEQPTAPGEMPLLNDFDTEADYKVAMSAWVKAEVATGVQQGGQRITQELTRTQKDAQRWAAIKAAAVDNPEINEVDYRKVQFTEDILDAAEGENFAIIAHDLGKNPAELARISALPLTQMVREIDKIGARLTAKLAQKTKTGAPDPPENDIGPGVGSPQPTKLEDMTTKQKMLKWDNDERIRRGIPTI